MGGTFYRNVRACIAQSGDFTHSVTVREGYLPLETEA